MSLPEVARPSKAVAVATALAFTALAMMLTLPAWISPEPALLGHPHSDVWKHVWGHWWVHAELLHNHHYSPYTTLQNFPWGGQVFVIDPFNALLSALLQEVLPLHAAFNLLVTAQMAFGAWAAWRFSFAITKSASASAIGGVVFGFSPWMLSYTVESGVSETLGIGWIPLAGLSCLNTSARGDRKDAILTGVALTLAGLGSWYYLLFALLLCALVRLAMAQPSTGLPAARPGSWRALVLALVIATLALLPLALQFVRSVSTAESLGPRERMAWTASDEYQEGFFSLSDFLVPGKDRLEISRVVDRLCKTPYIGWIALLLALTAVRRAPRATVVWGGGALLFALLSLGPRIHLTSSLESSANVNLPYQIGHWLLGFSLTTAPYRIHVLTLLCLGVLAAMAAAPLTARWPSVGWALAAAALAESCLASPAPFPLAVAPATVPAVYEGLHLSGAEGVLDVPQQRFASQLVPGEYYYYQTHHGGGIPLQVGGVFDARFARNPFFLEMWRLGAGRMPPTDDPVAAVRGLEELAESGYRYVIVHDTLPQAQHAYATEMLTRWLGPPEVRDGGRLRFRLDPVCP